MNVVSLMLWLNRGSVPPVVVLIPPEAFRRARRIDQSPMASQASGFA